MAQLLSTFWHDETGAVSISYAVGAGSMFVSMQVVRYMMGIMDDLGAGMEAQLMVAVR